MKLSELQSQKKDWDTVCSFPADSLVLCTFTEWESTQSPALRH